MQREVNFTGLLPANLQPGLPRRLEAPAASIFKGAKVTFQWEFRPRWRPISLKQAASTPNPGLPPTRSARDAAAVHLRLNFSVTGSSPSIFSISSAVI